MTDYPRLFSPTQINRLQIPNRFAMAPMTRQMSPDQTPTDQVVEYYRKRAAGGVGLIITEGTTLRSMESTMNEQVPKLDASVTVDAWRQVVQAVHAENAKIAVQIWHVGALRRPKDTLNPGVGIQSPSGLSSPGKRKAEPLTDTQIQGIIDDYVESARVAKEIGFDAIELHGAHGYLIDQFLWAGTNERSDRWGGDMLARSEFVCAVVRAVRKEVGPDYPLILRMSQWKQQEYTAKLADSPEDLERLLTVIVDAGLDSLHCSTRRYWEPEFSGSTLNFAGWAKKLTGIHTITVGSVGLDTEFIETYMSDDQTGTASHMPDLEARIEANEFDMVAVGRALIANPDWVALVRDAALSDAQGFTRAMLAELK
ncbi:MAG: NADH:flavin oxidoreductase [Gammaproteobacteria bacterium]